MGPPLKTLTIVGTRPEAIKLAPVIRRLAARDDVVNKVVLSGQHREMLHSALAIFGIAGDVDLALMTENQTLSHLTAALLSTLDPLFVRERPDWIIVQGDTTTAFAAALVAYYRWIPVVHVEAGLRTHDALNPFPEEINRLIDQLATLHFAPTEHARGELLQEGIDDEVHRRGGRTSASGPRRVCPHVTRQEPVRGWVRRRADRPGAC
jgi:UDP-N-acetylglucosamine 2-epimerase (non-hydrolysing)